MNMKENTHKRSNITCTDLAHLRGILEQLLQAAKEQQVLTLVLPCNYLSIFLTCPGPLVKPSGVGFGAPDKILVGFARNGICRQPSSLILCLLEVKSSGVPTVGGGASANCCSSVSSCVM